MYDTEDDDTHLCLKCSATIIGLKNYIAHRKQHCYKIVRSDNALTSVASPTTEHPYEPSSLRADDFFSSLELQSIQAVIPSTATKADHADYDLEDAEDSDNDLYPPTSHTGGKWKPGWGPTARSDWKAVCQHGHHLGLRRFRCAHCHFRAVRCSMLRRHELAVHRREVGPQSPPAAATTLRSNDNDDGDRRWEWLSYTRGWQWIGFGCVGCWHGICGIL
ncbi:hypothetical protein HPB52_015678 [Rhipicephalus sanguineus]|uniref:C2H2-type domain-containing protein n=1 Tax=Rhipicephalus sanguineus TaxID=34632 RepID=A0A9D4TAL4_RHISA|nr:hypothetical protein HPB52_015678 [Rhipicephalus sanguineus]